MLIDRITTMLSELNGEELDRMRPVDRRRFAALCHHWWQLAEKREAPKLRKLCDGERSQ